MRTVAALYVDPRGCYANAPGVEMWNVTLDARTYAGPHPVVAHPPCSRWCRLAGLVQARYPHLKRGQDDGCFAAALNAVRTWGGVLEHPAFSDAWPAFGLPVPASHGWQRGICGGWSAAVAQMHYGHRARKATWLYAYGIAAEDLPELRWSFPLAENSSPCAGETVEREREHGYGVSPHARTWRQARRVVRRSSATRRTAHPNGRTAPVFRSARRAQRHWNSWSYCSQLRGA